MLKRVIELEVYTCIYFWHCKIFELYIKFFYFTFFKKKLHAWILPIMQGYVQCEPCQIDEREFDFILISRRSRERAGMFYFNTKYLFKLYFKLLLILYILHI
jgi:hypothetical protein